MYFLFIFCYIILALRFRKLLLRECLQNFDIFLSSNHRIQAPNIFYLFKVLVMLSWEHKIIFVVVLVHLYRSWKFTLQAIQD